jgi:hypothetical protein
VYNKKAKKKGMLYINEHYISEKEGTNPPMGKRGSE